MKNINNIKNILEQKNISFHTSRHNFATLFLEFNPGDVATLKELLDHSKIEQTLVYVHITEQVKNDRMLKFDNLE